jgi:O-antigen ligase
MTRFFLLAAIAVGFAVRWEPAPFDLLAGGAIAAGLAHLWRGWTQLPRPLVVALCVFVLANVVGLTVAPDPLFGLRFAGVTFYLVLMWVLATVLGTQDRRHEDRDFVGLATRAYVLAAGFAAGLICLAFLGLLTARASELTWVIESMRPTGLFKDPNVAGSFLVGPAILYAEVLLQAGKRSAARAWLLYLLLLGAIILTGSRSALLAWGAGYAVCLFLVKAPSIRKLGQLKITVVFAALVLFCLSQTPGEPRRTFAIYNYDVGGRLFAWKAAFELWKGHPVLGVGPGNFEVLSPAVEREMGATFITPSAHNTYLRVLAENGAVGLAAFSAALVLTLWGARSSAKAGGSGTWLSAAFIGLLLNGMFLDTLHLRHFWLIWALLAARLRMLDERPQHTAP